MTLFLKRTVAAQIATELRNGIQSRVWSHWLPSERALSTMLQASRNSVRGALLQLKTEGVIVPVRGFSNKICFKSQRRPLRIETKIISIILPEVIGSLRPSIALWIDELKDLLAESKYRLRVYEGQQYYRKSPSRSLRRLLDQSPSAAWVLLLSSASMQHWFENSGVPCVVAGSLFPGVNLPSFDFDHRSVGRHAVGVLLRLGHRRVGLLSHQSNHAGDIQSRSGFLESVQAYAEESASAIIRSHNNDAGSVRRALDGMINCRNPVTGILVCGSYAYLAASTQISYRGLRIPLDVSLISRDDDSFLEFLEPSPTRYLIKPHIFAKNIYGIIQRLGLGHSVKHLKTCMLPQLLTCCSTCGPAKRKFGPVVPLGSKKEPPASICRARCRQ